MEFSKRNLIDIFKLREVLNGLSKENLVEIIEDVTEKDEELKNKLIVKYSKDYEGEEIERCENLISYIVKKYTEKEGYICHKESYDFVSDMEELLEKVHHQENKVLSLEIAILVLNEAIRAFQYADNSRGYIGNLVLEVIDIIREIVEHSSDLNIDIRKKLFNKLSKECDNRVFDGWTEYKIDLLRICTNFCDIEEIRETLIGKIKFLIKGYFNDKYGKHRIKSLVKILFYIVKKYSTKEEGQAFIKNNLKFPHFRQFFINNFIKKKEYTKVIKLALDGEKQDKDCADLVLNWKRIRYDAYKNLSMEENQQKLAKELFLYGNFEFYKDLKKVIKEDKVFYNNLKKELKNKKDEKIEEIYLKLILQENDVDEIMEYVRENIDTVEDYAEILADKFKDEIIDIYSKHIERLAMISMKREDYKYVCMVIKKYESIAGEENKQKIISKLGTLNKRRLAFLDELNKIK
ncbi:hypothetical protein [Clostridium oceanicum]|uniref:Uncharacterized protein n=1 Tax=Clostridium oceanicum TaxID=1543 RepID=A0ABP3URY7_9CLOT